MIYLGKNAVGISDTVQVVPEDIVNRVNAVEIKETVSTPSNIVTIYDGAKDIPVDEIVVGIEPVQSGSGDPATDNVRSISGWTGANINVGKNEYLVSTITTGKTLNTTGGIDNSDLQQFITDKIYVNPGDTYTISFTSTYGARTRRIIGFNSNNELTETLYNATWVTVGNKVKSILTIGQNTTYVILTGYTLDEDIFFGKTPATYSVTFPSEAGTVYGGTLTAYKDGTGTLIVDRANIASYAGETLPGEWISDRDVYSAGATPTTGAQVVYALAESVSYELTASQITTLLGTNHIWADTGDILSLTYSADPKMYADQNKGVSDVQVNGTSVVQDGVANVPVATNDRFGLVQPYGPEMTFTNEGYLRPKAAGIDDVKSANAWKFMKANVADSAAFYGLAKAAGDTTQSASSNAVGTYTETAKSAISQMLSAPVTVSGTTPSITALPGVRYICGECSTLSITVPESGIIDVTFTSGSTATVLTVTPPTGMTMHWANGFDPTSLDANTVYEINIMDGEWGMAAEWT